MNTENNALDFRDPGPMSHELLSVPGFVNELKNHTLAVAPRPNEPLAFAGALAMLAHLSGRSYRDRRGGKLDHSTLLKRLPVDATLFRKLVETLKMCDLIEDEVLPNGKHGYSLSDAA